MSAKTGLGMDDLRPVSLSSLQMTSQVAPSVDPSTASRCTAGGGSSGGCGTGRFAGIARRGPAAGDAGTGANYGSRRGGGHSGHGVLALLHREIGLGGASVQHGQPIGVSGNQTYLALHPSGGSFRPRGPFRIGANGGSWPEAERQLWSALRQQQTFIYEACQGQSSTVADNKS